MRIKRTPVRAARRAVGMGHASSIGHVDILVGDAYVDVPRVWDLISLNVDVQSA